MLPKSRSFVGSQTRGSYGKRSLFEPRSRTLRKNWFILSALREEDTAAGATESARNRHATVLETPQECRVDTRQKAGEAGKAHVDGHTSHIQAQLTIE